jgi:hypothetical protein
VGVVVYFLVVYAVLAGVFAACLSGMLAVLPGRLVLEKAHQLIGCSKKQALDRGTRQLTLMVTSNFLIRPTLQLSHNTTGLLLAPSEITFAQTTFVKEIAEIRAFLKAAKIKSPTIGAALFLWLKSFSQKSFEVGQCNIANLPANLFGYDIMVIYFFP